jgi:hypothetical protein
MDKRTDLLLKSQRRVTELEKELKQRNIDIDILQDQFNVMEIDRDYWQGKYRLLQQGALIYTEDSEGYVDNAVCIPNDFVSTFMQDVPKEIGTIAYNRTRFYKVVNGVVEIDKDKYKKYIGGIM